MIFVLAPLKSIIQLQFPRYVAQTHIDKSDLSRELSIWKSHLVTVVALRIEFISIFERPKRLQWRLADIVSETLL